MRVVQFGEAAAQEPLVRTAVEQGSLESEGSEAIALGFGDALDQAVQAEAAQVVGHTPGADLGLGESEQLRKQWPQLAITEALGLETEQDHYR